MHLFFSNQPHVPFFVAMCLLVAHVLVGCSGEVKVSKGRDFLGATETLSDCSMACLTNAAQFAYAGVGLDPTKCRHASRPSWQGTVNAILVESGGGAMKSFPVMELLNKKKVGPMDPVFLENKSGHVYVVLGTIKVEGELMWQVLHGSSPVILVSKDFLSRGEFDLCWSCKETRGPVVSIGNSPLVFDKILHNFGEIKAEDTLRCSFHLTNTGSEIIVVEETMTSCSCISTSIKANEEIEAGQSLDIELSMRAPGTASMKEPVVLRLREKNSGSSEHVSLWLFGTYLKLVDISPKHLNFGLVSRKQTYSKTVLLKQLSDLVYTLSEVLVDDTLIVCNVKKKKRYDGLHSHKLDLMLKIPGDAKPGEYRSYVSLVFEGDDQRNAIIPVSYVIEEAIKVSPSRISFGALRCGQLYERKIKIIPGDGSSITKSSVQLNCLHGCSDAAQASIVESKPLEIKVRLMVNSLGIWIGNISLHVETNSGLKQTFDIPVVGEAS